MLARAGILGHTLKIAAAAGLVAALAGCGQTQPKAAAPVRLSLLAPADSVRVSTREVTVTGTVKPHDARVLVSGHRVNTSATGRFSTAVPLVPGANLIDVIAGAPHAQPEMTALRVTRYVLVSVPSVGGMSPKQAAAAIRAAGLVPKVNGDGDPLAFLVPGSYEVCSQTPRAHAHVNPGSTVSVDLGKLCI